MKKYLGWIFVFMASLTVVSAFADDTASNDDQVAYGDVDQQDEMEEIEE